MLYDVIIAGAGPVGLFLACDLRLANCSVLVLEKEFDSQSPLKNLPFGMRGLWGPSIEAFYRRGLLADIEDRPPVDSPAAPGPILGQPIVGQPTPGSTAIGGQRSGPAGHFAGIPFDHGNVDTSRWTYRLPGPSDTQLGRPMEFIERVLSARALSLGVDIQRGYAVEHIEQTDDDVLVHTDAQQFRGRYLVGCDGGRSAVRKLAGFEFVGTDAEFTGYSIMVDIAAPNPLRMGRHYTPTGMYTQWQPGTIGMVDFDGGAFHTNNRRTHAITREHVQDVLRRVSCTDVTVTAVHLASTWTDRSMQATTYRSGRVLLAGDAAHIHSPLGGQGLNLGLDDAMNLGWKLEATIRNEAPEGLLDSYTAERHPIGARILDWTRAHVAIMKPTPAARALETIFRDVLATRDGATYFAERVWGVTVRYDLGDAHPLVGMSCPDFAFDDGTRVGELLRDGCGLLIDFGGRAGLQALAGALGTRVKYVARDADERTGLTALLVRPDGFVAWVSEGAASVEDVASAAARWFAQG